MAEAVVASKAVGTVLGIAGQIRQGNADANVSEYNAQVANQNASLVMAQGQEEARRSMVNARKVMGAQAAGYGASGVDQTGSALWVLRNTAAQAELNKLTIENNAAVKATAFQNQAGLDLYRAGNERVRGYLGAASSLLNGAGSIAGSVGGGGGDAGGIGGEE